jgi:hypothetical protein
MAAKTNTVPGHSIPKQNVLEIIRPKSRIARIQLLSIIGFIIAAILGVMAIGHFANKTREYREQNWNSAVATVKDTRTHLVGEFGGFYGGRMYYEVQVLAAFSADGSPHERWITVSQTPKTLDNAEFQERLWKGKQYFVRWNPSDPNQIVIDLH